MTGISAARTIVVGVDGSPASRKAADWALRRARSSGSSLMLVRTVLQEWGPDGGHNDLASTDQARTESAARALEAERSRLAAVGPHVSVDVRIEEGEPAAVLCALSHAAELVVVGSDRPADAHGEGFGAVGLQIVIRSSCPVAIIPEHAQPGTGVVVGVDGSPEGRWALQVAAAEAQSLGTPLTVVHAGPAAHPDRAGDAEPADDAGEGLLAEAAASAAATHPGLEVRRVLDTGHRPAQALAAAAQGAALLVVGNRGADAVRHMVPGAIGQVVLAALPCPTLVTPVRHPAP